MELHVVAGTRPHGRVSKHTNYVVTFWFCVLHFIMPISPDLSSNQERSPFHFRHY